MKFPKAEIRKVIRYLDYIMCDKHTEFTCGNERDRAEGARSLLEEVLYREEDLKNE